MALDSSLPRAPDARGKRTNDVRVRGVRDVLSELDLSQGGRDVLILLSWN